MKKGKVIKMEEKKKKLSVEATIILTVFFTLLIIVAIGVTFFINHLYDEQQQQVNELKEELNEVKSNIQTEENEENTTNLNSTNSQNNNQTTDTINEVRNITGIGYTAKLYSNNDIKITIGQDIEAIVGEVADNIKNNTYSVTGITGNIKDIYSGNIGTGVEPAILCILEDGTVEYVDIFTQLRDNATSLRTDGKINGLTNIVEIKEANDGDGMIAVQPNGTELKFWNRPENVE